MQDANPVFRDLLNAASTGDAETIADMIAKATLNVKRGQYTLHLVCNYNYRRWRAAYPVPLP